MKALSVALVLVALVATVSALEDPANDRYETSLSVEWVNAVLKGETPPSDATDGMGASAAGAGVAAAADPGMFSTSELDVLGDDTGSARVFLHGGVEAGDGAEDAEGHAVALDAMSAEALEHHLDGVESSVEPVEAWAEPRPYTEADVRAIAGLGADAPLGKVLRFVLEYTNMQITEGGAQTNLEDNVRSLSSTSAPLMKTIEARVLDRHYELAPLEDEVRKIVDHNRLTGGPHVEALPVYKGMLVEYVRSGRARKEAKAVYDSVHTVYGTDEDTLLAVLQGRTQDEIRLLAGVYERVVMAEDGVASLDATTYPHNGHRSLMEAHIYDDVSGGWRRKLRDCLESAEVFGDAAYFFSSSAAEQWGEYLQRSHAGARWILDHGGDDVGGFMRTVAWANQALFASTQGVNQAVKDAQTYYLEMAKQHEDNALMSVVAKTGFVLSSVGGSFGTKALDHTLTPAEIEEGLVDAALLIGSFGASGVVTAAAKTPMGMRAFASIGAACHKMSVWSYGVRHALRVTGRHYGKYDDLAKGTAALAEKLAAQSPARADALKTLSRKYAAAAKQAARADTAMTLAKETQHAARVMLKSAHKTSDDVLEAVKAANEAAAHAKREVLALRDAQKAIVEAKQSASALTHSAVGRVHDHAKRVGDIDIIPMRVKKPKAVSTSDDVAGASASTSDDVAGAGASTSDDVAGASASTSDDVAGASASTSDDVAGASASTSDDVAGAGASDDAAAAGAGTKADDLVEVTIDDLPTSAEGYGQARAISKAERADAMAELRKYIDDVEAETGIRYPEDAFEPVWQPINPYLDEARVGMSQKRLKETLVAFDDWQHILAFKLKKDVKVYRVGGFHDQARGTGKWFTLKPTRSEKELRGGLAVIDDFLKRPEVNWEGTLKEGSMVYFGKTAPQFGGAGAKVHHGGEMQMFMSPKLGTYVPEKAHLFRNMDEAHLVSEAAADAVHAQAHANSLANRAALHADPLVSNARHLDGEVSTHSGRR